MKRLEDIPKKDIFKVPEGYFEDLPSIIQSRVAGQKKERAFLPSFSFGLRYALPVVILGAIGYFWFNPAKPKTAESILATIETEDLVAYLNETDLTTDELLESVQLDANDVDHLEDEVYGEQLSDEDLDEILDEI
ncbi:MAG TPA: hypothetical protein VK589_11245 [Chryseolinea sp.]|nr:hypothetical protein [Chryseolinea sp.]